MKGFILLLSFFSYSFGFNVLAHPGRTAADGCHYCRTNCASWGYTTGTRHCHGGSISATTNITNYTIPATPIVKHTETEREKPLSEKLKGKILLQIEDKGQAWYVNPKTGKRHYMPNGNEAFLIMRNLGVGITNADLSKIKNDKAVGKKHSGKIFLQIEDKGQAYYIDFNGVAHYLKDGSVAFRVMRELGLGIKNSDLYKIDIF